MSTKIRHKEYPTLGDFIKTSFVRDQTAISESFPKLNAGFLDNFNEKLQAVKELESRRVLTHEQKNITASLYAEVDTLNKELNFLNLYISVAGLNPTLVSDLKTELSRNNIEDALAKIEDVKEFITYHSAILREEGMSNTFPAKLEAHKVSIAQKNAHQNSIMNTAKSLTDTNKAMYQQLYNLIIKIADAGKLVFGGTATEDEYIITKVLSRMRGPQHAEKTAEMS